MIPLLLTRWRFGLSLFAALAFIGVGFAAKHYRHAYHAEKSLREADRANYANAQAEAARIAQEALRATEARYKRNADHAQDEYAVALAGAKSAALAYASAHRVRFEADQGSPGATSASAQGGGSGVSASLSSDAFVAVSDADLQACTDASIYAMQAHDWAVTP